MAVKTIGVFAHVDSGKTTLCESLLSVSNKNESEKKSNVFDFHEVERAKGITVFSEQATAVWKGKKLNIIDTPGHSDFFSELEKSVLPLDAAVLVVSAADGISSQTRKIWKILREKHIPTVIFINKMDQVFWDSSKIIKAVSDFDNRALFIGDISNKKFIFDFQKASEIEKLAELDDEFLETYLSNNHPDITKIQATLKRQAALGRVFPVIMGSATQKKGIVELLDFIGDFLPDYSKDDDGPFWGVTYRVKHSPGYGRVVYIKVLSGSIGTRENVFSAGREQKVLELYSVDGKTYVPVDRVYSGDLVAVLGLGEVNIGDYVGIPVPSNFELKSGLLVSRLKPLKIEDSHKLVEALNILADEDLSLDIDYGSDENILISVQGTTQIEVLKSILKSRFNIEVKFIPPVPKYRESVLGTAKGFCHYEPKKHYAEVEVEVSQNINGENTYSSKVPLDLLPAQYQSQIEKTVKSEAMLKGPLGGFPLMGINVSLVRGRHHLEHTHGGDFRIATIRAVRSALEKCSPVLMEPFYEFLILVNKEFLGKVNSELLSTGAIISNQNHEDNFVKVEGELPVSVSGTFSSKLDIISGGEAYVIFENGSYLECSDPNKIRDLVKQQEDTLYNSISIFREKKKMKKVKGI